MAQPVLPPEFEERPELPPETRELIVQYREDQLAIRTDRTAAVASYLEENPNASAEEIREVVKAFNEENADLLAAQAEARQAIREDIRELLPELPEETQDKLVEYRSEAERLRTGRRAAVDAHLSENPDATPEEIRNVVAAYNQANSEDIANNIALRRDIRGDVRELRDLPPPLDRETVSARRQEILANVEGLSAELKALRAELKQDLQAEGADKEAIIREFRETQMQILQDAKNAARDRIRAEREEGRG